MTDYKYAEPQSAQEAMDRINHWMPDILAFQQSLGLHDPGFDQKPYYPTFSGTHTENGTWDAMVAADMSRYPDRWPEPAAPVAPLPDGWLGAVVGTWYDAKRFWNTWTDPEHAKRFARELIKKVWGKLWRRKETLLAKLGEPKPHTRTPLKRPMPWPALERVDPSPFDFNTLRAVNQKIAEEQADQGVRENNIKANDPRNDSGLFDS